MKMRLIRITLLAFVILIGSAVLVWNIQGQETTKTCAGSILQTTEQSNLCIGTDCKVINITKNITCDYGCNEIDKVCNPVPYMKTIIVGLILIGIFSIGMFLWKRI